VTRSELARGCVVVLALPLTLALIPPARALPAYSRLYQAKYSYRPSCAACHTSGGGSTVTEYGRDFLRGGANYAAFAKIEGKDSDIDGVLNLAEITARANPGDARSTPSTLGDWLAGAVVVPVPTDQLKTLFPAADSFGAVEGTLNATQAASVAANASVTLTEEDKVPTFYFASLGGKKFAVAQYVSAASAQGPISLAVCMDVGGSVTAVKVLKNPAAKGIEEAGFLGQFVGRRLADAPTLATSVSSAPGAPAESLAVASAVAKAIATINAVFSKG
jgi:hypothetical protein